MAFLVVSNNADSGAGSLRAAIAAAQNGDTIVFQNTLANQTITLTSGQISIAPGRNITIDGSGAPGVTISGNNASRIFFVNANVVTSTTVTVENLRLANGFTTARGGAIATADEGSLVINNVVFDNNRANQGGGAIWVDINGSLRVDNSQFTGNQAIASNDERGGGAIAFLSEKEITIRNSTFTNNRGINGGAVNSLNGLLTIENTSFVNNDTLAAVFASGQPNDFLRGYGGALYTDRANNSITIRNTRFEGNQGRAEGGAAHLFVDPSDVVTIENSLFLNNSIFALPGGTPGNGGAIAHVRNSLDAAGRLTITGTTFAGNTATNQGGGLWMNNTTTQIVNSTFSGNQTLGSDFNSFGGGMSLGGPTELVNVTMANNVAGWVGGALVAGDSFTVGTRNSIFANNTSNNPFNVQKQTNRELTDRGGNIQWPPKQTNNFNDFNVTASVLLADPLLGPLENIGGFLVHPLLVGSPAINSGVSGGPATDQRGVTRDAQPDRGAFEVGGTPSLPTLSINDVNLVEGNSGTANMVFTVTLSASSTQTVTVNYATADGTATAGQDYTATSGTLTFAAGQTIQTINVPILGDTTIENNETFVVNLSNASNATIAGGQGQGTIINDDGAANQAPVNTVPTNQTTNRNTALTFAVATGNAVSIADPDAGNNPLRVNFTAANGSVALANTSGLTVVGGANGTANLTVEGTLTSLNTALAGLSFNPTPNFTGNASLTIVTNDQGSGIGTPLVDTDTIAINVTAPSTPPPTSPPGISRNSNNIFTAHGSANTSVQFLFTLTGRGGSAINEIGVFSVDDEQGTVNGLTPGSSGYLAAALARAQVLFSSLSNLPTGFNAASTPRQLSFSTGTRLRFYLVQNSSTEAVVAGQTGSDRVLFSSPMTLQVTDLGNNLFNLAWEDNTGLSDFRDLVIQLQLTNQPAPIGSQTPPGAPPELLDLRGFAGQTLQAQFFLYREAAFNNTVGFYGVNDFQGTVTDPFTGATLTPGQAGYTQAALRNRVQGLELTGANQAVTVSASQLPGGSILAPFVVINSRVEPLLDSNPNNDPVIYFPFIGANSDRQDHFRLLANNTFGIEDLPGLGDGDFNDVIVQYRIG